MPYFSINFGELTTEGLIDTGALTGAILEADLLALEAFLNEGPPPDFQIEVANGYLELPRATVELQLQVDGILFKKTS